MTIDNNRLQLKNTNFLAIDWSSISDINRLTVIDCHRLLSIIHLIDWSGRAGIAYREEGGGRGQECGSVQEGILPVEGSEVLNLFSLVLISVNQAVGPCVSLSLLKK